MTNDEISARGFAIVIDGKIDMRTVFPHARGAVVNWLVTDGVLIIKGMSDEDIFALWDQSRGDAMVQPVKVTVVLSATE